MESAMAWLSVWNGESRRHDVPGDSEPPGWSGVRRGTSLDSSTLPVSDTQDTALARWCAGCVLASDTLHAMRRWLLVIVVAVAALVAVLVVGLNQASNSSGPSQP